MKELLEKFKSDTATIDEVLAAIENQNKDMVPRSRLNDKNDEIKELKDQIVARDKQITDLSASVKGNEELSNTIKTLQDDNANWSKKYSKTLMDTSVKTAALQANAVDPADILTFIKREGLQLQEDGSVKGLEEAIKTLQENKPYLFKSADQLHGKPPVPPGQKDPNTMKNPWKKESFNLTQQAKILTENPELAAKLQAIAK